MIGGAAIAEAVRTDAATAARARRGMSIAISFLEPDRPARDRRGIPGSHTHGDRSIDAGIT
jgi:hypothetical protein